MTRQTEPKVPSTGSYLGTTLALSRFLAYPARAETCTPSGQLWCRAWPGATATPSATCGRCRASRRWGSSVFTWGKGSFSHVLLTIRTVRTKGPTRIDKNGRNAIYNQNSNEPSNRKLAAKRQVERVSHALHIVLSTLLVGSKLVWNKTEQVSQADEQPVMRP